MEKREIAYKNEESKSVLFVLGLLDDLKKDGFVNGGAKLSKEGRKIYEEIRDSNFKMSQKDIGVVMDVIREYYSYVLSDKAAHIFISLATAGIVVAAGIKELEVNKNGRKRNKRTKGKSV